MNRPIVSLKWVMVLILPTLFFLACESADDEAAIPTEEGAPSTITSTPPIILSTIPADGATAVAVNTGITVAFNEAMDSATITTNTADTNCSGTIQVSSDSFGSCVQMLRTPIANGQKTSFALELKSDLSSFSTYQIKVTTGAKDLAGNALASEFLSSQGFTTGSGADTTLPTVVSTDPADSTTDVVLNPEITVVFSEAIQISTVTTNTVNTTCDRTFVVSADNFSTCIQMSSDPSADAEQKAFTIFPVTDLAYNTTYKIKITVDIKDLSGNALSSEFVTTNGFTTISDTVAPSVSSVVPANGATGATINTSITVNFSEGMNPASVTTTTFTLDDGTNAVTGTVAYNGTTAIFTPSGSLSGNQTYNAIVTTGVTDLAGNPLASDYTWSFTTGAQPAGIWDSGVWDSDKWGD